MLKWSDQRDGDLVIVYPWTVEHFSLVIPSWLCSGSLRVVGIPTRADLRASLTHQRNDMFLPANR
jgi:hypothetical protein